MYAVLILMEAVYRLCAFLLELGVHILLDGPKVVYHVRFGTTFSAKPLRKEARCTRQMVAAGLF